MNKENILFGIIGLVAGLVIGFMFANSVNRSAVETAVKETPSGMSENADMPAGHPEVGDRNKPTISQMENIPAVQEALEKAKAEPGNYDAQIKAAGFNYQIGKYEEAIEILQRASKLKPDETVPLVMIGNSYFDMEKYAEAEKFYLDALAKTPDDISIRTDLGLTFVLRATPDYDRAIEEFNKSLATEPKHLQTLQNLIVAYVKKGDAANARATLAKVEAIDPKNETLGRLREEVSKIGN